MDEVLFVKKLVVVFIIIGLIFVSSPDLIVHAQNKEIGVVINGEIQQFDAAPISINGSVLVPMRAIFEKMHAKLSWNEGKQQVSATKGATQIVLTINRKTAWINGKAVSLNVAPQLVNGKTMVPLRFVGEALHADVKWDQKKNAVDITFSNQEVVPEPNPSTNSPIKTSDEEKIINLLNANNDSFINHDADGFIRTYEKIKETKAELLTLFATSHYKQSIESINHVKIAGNEASATMVRVVEIVEKPKTGPEYISLKQKVTFNCSFIRINNEWKIRKFEVLKQEKLSVREENDRLFECYALQGLYLHYREEEDAANVLTTLHPDNPSYKNDWVAQFANDDYKFELVDFKLIKNTSDYIKAEVVILYKKGNAANPKTFDSIDKITSVIEYKKTKEGWKILSEALTKTEEMANPN